MKKISILLFTFIAAYNMNAIGQNCTAMPLGWEKPISNDTTMNTIGIGVDSIVICSGTTVTYNTPNNILFAYVEDGSELIVQAADGPIVYLEPNATLTIDTASWGSVNGIFVTYETGSSIMVDTSQILSNNTYNGCVSISFDYGNYPNGMSPCPITTDIAESISTADIRVFPNPANGMVVVKAPHQGQFTLTDAQGRLVTTGNYNQQLDLRAQSKGLYFVTLHNGETRKLILTE